ncbi:MAG: hypothetical protein ACREXG_05660 [Polaromonas sp.]
MAGFVEPPVNELPMEYAIEMNGLLQLQMAGSVGKPEALSSVPATTMQSVAS